MIEVEILSTPGCRSCQAAKNAVEDLIEKQKEHFPDLTWKDVDLTEHEDYILKYNVMSTPVVVINGKKEIDGTIKETELVAALEKYR